MDSQRNNKLTSILFIFFAIFGILFLMFPPLFLIFSIHPTAFFQTLVSSDALQAIKLSLFTSTISTCCCLALGVPVAWWLSQHPNAKFVRIFIIIPVITPPVIGGLALLMTYGKQSPFGSFLFTSFNITISFTTLAVIIAQTYVSLPFLILTAETSMKEIDSDVYDSAKLSGANSITIARKIIIPIAKSGIITGAVLAWARAFGEFGATLIFAGFLKGKTQTLSLTVYDALQYSPETARTLSVVMFCVAGLVILSLRKKIR